MNKPFNILPVLTALVVGTACVSTGTSSAPRNAFSDIDTNTNGAISPAEFSWLTVDPATGKAAKMKAADFSAIDTNGDGQISEDEWMVKSPDSGRLSAYLAHNAWYQLGSLKLSLGA